MKLFSPVLTVLFAAAIAGADKGPGALAARLEIEGKFVEKLALENRRGVLRVIERPGPSWSLPAGQYRVREVHLRGGFRCNLFPDAEQGWFTLSEEEPYQLDVGAPLTPKVKVTRRLRVLTLQYQLLDAGGRDYGTEQQTVPPPQFAVYSGDRKIGSGAFEYG